MAVTIVILLAHEGCVTLVRGAWITKVTPSPAIFFLMSDSKPAAKGADWTRLLADPDLVSHLAELLRTYRDSPPAAREQALLEAVRKIKDKQAKFDEDEDILDPDTMPSAPLVVDPGGTPPYEPSIFSKSWGDDRRRAPRMKCFVVIELRAAQTGKPAWGNLSNISLGGCLVETPMNFVAGSKVGVGLWVPSGQIWIKGMVLNGVVARTNPSHGLRLRFAEMDSSERETLRQFLKFVDSSAKSYESDFGYLAQLKR